MAPPPWVGIICFVLFSMVSLSPWVGISLYSYNAAIKITNECLHHPQQGSIPIQGGGDELVPLMRVVETKFHRVINN